MIEQISPLTENVLAYRAVGEVTADDYETVLTPAIDEAIAHQRKINLVYVLGDQFERYSAGGAWQDALLEGKPHNAWGRIALVTDHSIIGEIVHALAFLVPAELKIFATTAEQEAIDWAADGPKE